MLASSGTGAGQGLVSPSPPGSEQETRGQVFTLEGRAQEKLGKGLAELRGQPTPGSGEFGKKALISHVMGVEPGG